MHRAGATIRRRHGQQVHRTRTVWDRPAARDVCLHKVMHVLVAAKMHLEGAHNIPSQPPLGRVGLSGSCFLCPGCMAYDGCRRGPDGTGSARIGRNSPEHTGVGPGWSRHLDAHLPIRMRRFRASSSPGVSRHLVPSMRTTHCTGTHKPSLAAHPGTRTHTHVRAHTYTHTRAHKHRRLQTRTRTHADPHTHTCTRVCAHTRSHVGCMCVCR